MDKNKIVEIDVNKIPKNYCDDDLKMLIGADKKAWSISQSWIKTNQNQIKGVSVSLVPNQKLDFDLEYFTEKIKSFTHKFPKIQKHKIKKENETIVVPLFDLHFGKLCYNKETGNDFDLKIAAKRLQQILKNVITKINLKTKEVIVVIDGDLLHIDNLFNSTSRGTQQNVDGSYNKLLDFVFEEMTSFINTISNLKNVKLFFVRGNHSETNAQTFFAGLEWIYKNDKRISFYNENLKYYPRKYCEIGNNVLAFGHYDKEQNRAFAIFDYEANKNNIDINNKNKFIIAGHFHHKQKSSVVLQNDGGDLISGIRMFRVGSPSGTDKWHCDSGYTTTPKTTSILIFNDQQFLAEWEVWF